MRKHDEVITYKLSQEPILSFLIQEGVEITSSLRNKIEEKLPNRGSVERQSIMLETAYRACVIDDPREVVPDFSIYPYLVKDNQIIIPKIYLEGRRGAKPVFFLRRDVREHEEGMREYEIERLFESDEKAIPHLEFTSVLFVTKD